MSSMYGKDLSKFVNEFQFPDSEINRFISFSSPKDVTFNEEEYKIDKGYITTRLKAQLARNFWKNEGWYSVMVTTDNQIEKAFGLFDEAKEIANIK